MDQELGGGASGHFLARLAITYNQAVENIPPGFGPEPAARDVEDVLTRPQAAVLHALAQNTDASLTELRALTGMHENTLRAHLQALLERGLVSRTKAPADGRGRPAWRYRSTPRAASSAGEYAGLAAALAAALAHHSPDPVGDAVAAGVEWGQTLAASAAPKGSSQSAARSQVVALFDGMRFAPSPPAADGGVRLRRCPLLDAAKRYPEVVCNVHVGIARGALQAYGADDSGVRLAPFAEPGACVLHLTPPRRTP